MGHLGVFQHKIFKISVSVGLGLGVSACIQPPELQSPAQSQSGVTSQFATALTNGSVPAVLVQNTRTTANVFFSGHSLVNRQMPYLLSAIAQQKGKTHRYNTQIGNGSNMQLRLDTPSNGENRDGGAMGFSILNEIPNATTIGAGNRYDTLVFTEAVPLTSQVLWANSIANAERFYDLIHANPNARAFLYEVWEATDGMTALEWATQTENNKSKWECILSRTNQNITMQNQERLRMLPAAQALAYLVREAQAGRVPGLANPMTLFSDNIHLTALGNYYISLVQYTAIYGDSPEGTSASIQDSLGNAIAGLPSSTTAAVMQDLAYDFVTAYNQSLPPERSDAYCRAVFEPECSRAWCYGAVLTPMFPTP